MISIHHLEVDITQKCSLSCTCCNHLVVPWRSAPEGPWSTTPEQVEADLFPLAKILHADILGALGGEPTLHPKLVDILRVMRDSAIADKIEVWTHGMQLNRMKPDFWKAFDVLVLSIYPGKHDEASLNWITQKCLDEGVELSVRDERLNPNFRSLLEPVPTDYETTKRKFAGCFFRHFSRSVNHGYFYTCCCWGMPMLLQGKPHGTDGVSISGLTEEGLLSYLNRTEPLGCCTICAGRDTAVQIEWSEEKEIGEWLDKSKGLSRVNPKN